MSRAKSLISKLEEMHYSTMDPNVRNIARGMEMNPVDSPESVRNNMIFDYGGRKVVVNTETDNVVVSVDGTNLLTTPKVDFDLLKTENWNKIRDLLKGKKVD